MGLYERLISGECKLAVIGMGYVGMPLALAFAEHLGVIGFDVNQRKIEQYQSGFDPTMEAGNEKIRRTKVEFTSDENRLSEAGFFVVAVPTPIYDDKKPDLRPVESACEIVGRHLSQGAIVVFESTVYPGVTEHVCVPILEKTSGLRCGTDFKVGYSPERINPGDRVHRLENIRKIVSGMDEESLEVIRRTYDLIIEAGTYPVSNIRTAEAIKLVENSQRDINIAFMNELAMLFDLIDIDTNEVVDGMNTKWNALGFRPGLVGGHCIGVDPYYLVYEAEKQRFTDQIVMAARRVNDVMGKFIARATIRQMSRAGLAPSLAKVVILGLTFKENCPDIRNTRVVDIIDELKEYSVEPIVCDPLADPEEVRREYGIELADPSDLHGVDCLIVAVAHDRYKDLTKEEILAFFEGSSNARHVLIDVKGIYGKHEFEKMENMILWRL
ncbi:MAG: nucleotide sugar dehydrogenase [Clostridia bacterium]|nr:nucleotide sugar dehydrogenase [Clostridia bacterium]